MKLKPRHFTPTAILTLMASVSSFFASAQTEQKVTEIMIVEDKAPDTVNVNGKKTSVYELQSLDSEPEYPGGVSGLMSFLGQNLVYPESAVQNNIQGKVLVKFVVTKEGNVANVEVIQSVDPALDAEAVRVVSLMKGFTPGILNGEKVNVWYVLPVNYRLQDDRQDIQYEVFDAVEIDSVGYKEMMDLGIKSRQENNLPHAIAYFKEAYHINPYSIEPIENITAMNTAVGKKGDNQAVFEYAIDELTRWNRLNGTGNSAVEPMEYLAAKMKSIDADNIYPRTSLLWAYLETRNPDYEMKVKNLLDELIPATEKQELWPQYGYLMSLRACFIENEKELIPFVEPNADKLAKSPQGVGALVMLSRMYREQNDNAKADKYMKMAEQADPEREELPKWLE